MAETDSRELPAPAAPPRPSWEIAARPAPPAQGRALPAAASESAPPAPVHAAPAQSLPSAPPALFADPGARYDLAGNLIGSGPSPSPYAPPAGGPPPLPAPYGYSPGPAAGTWPPAPTAGPLTKSNNSGELDWVPDEIARKIWNWGAFFFPILWLRKHNMTTVAGMISMSIAVPRMLHAYAPFLPYVNLLALAGLLAYWAVRVYFGISGHKFAWRNRHFPDGVQEHFKVQRAWMLWGFGLFALDIAVQILVVGPLITGGTPARPLHGASRAGAADGSDDVSPADKSDRADPPEQAAP